ncbi:hypothetical protein [Fluviicola sp.]|uniref:hypothetical protein n=1 Tax=Fluviicola sp. TaxID=1917219 RepID=UPI0031DE6C78
MKNAKLILLITTMMLLGIYNANAQQENPQTVIIRTIESAKTGATNSSMMIITPNGDKKVVPLSGHNFSNYSEKTLENSVIIQQEITKWQKEGFRIISFSTDGGDIYARAFIILTKE